MTEGNDKSNMKSCTAGKLGRIPASQDLTYVPIRFYFHSQGTDHCGHREEIQVISLTIRDSDEVSS